MKMALLTSLLMLSAGTLEAQLLDKAKPANLVLDEPTGQAFPSHFRATRLLKTTLDESINWQGLAGLNASASGQFSVASLQRMLDALEHPEIVLCDLRRESHGFVNGYPLSWYASSNIGNAELATADISVVEDAKLKALITHPQQAISLYLDKDPQDGALSQSISLMPERVESEQSLAHRLGLGYQRFFVKDHHSPEEHEIDHFLDFVSHLKPQQALHFHCRKGWGRSTTFMVLFDIIKNGEQVSLEDIITRQTVLGGRDLRIVSNEPEKAWKRQHIEQRLQFIEKFYQFRRAPDGFAHQPWSSWLREDSK